MSLDEIFSGIAVQQNQIVALLCEAIGSSCETDSGMEKPEVFTFSTVEDLMTFMQKFGESELEKEREECDEFADYKKFHFIESYGDAYAIESTFGNHRITRLFIYFPPGDFKTETDGIRHLLTSFANNGGKKPLNITKNC